MREKELESPAVFGTLKRRSTSSMGIEELNQMIGSNNYQNMLRADTFDRPLNCATAQKLHIT